MMTGDVRLDPAAIARHAANTWRATERVRRTLLGDDAGAVLAASEAARLDAMAEDMNDGPLSATESQDPGLPRGTDTDGAET